MKWRETMPPICRSTAAMKTNIICCECPLLLWLCPPCLCCADLDSTTWAASLASNIHRVCKAANIDQLDWDLTVSLSLSPQQAKCCSGRGEVSRHSAGLLELLAAAITVLASHPGTPPHCLWAAASKFFEHLLFQNFKHYYYTTVA